MIPIDPPSSTNLPTFSASKSPTLRQRCARHQRKTEVKVIQHEKLMAVTSANLRATAKTKRSRAGGEILTWLPSGND
jgi:hypothetical protein